MVAALCRFAKFVYLTLQTRKSFIKFSICFPCPFIKKHESIYCFIDLLPIRQHILFTIEKLASFGIVLASAINSFLTSYSLTILLGKVILFNSRKASFRVIYVLSVLSSIKAFSRTCIRSITAFSIFPLCRYSSSFSVLALRLFLCEPKMYMQMMRLILVQRTY